MSATVQGRAWKLGDNVSGDDGIIQFSQVPDLGRFDIPALKAMCLVTLRPEFPAQVQAGDLLVAGRNFAIQNHMHASVALKESGIRCIAVESCDTGFLRKSLNIGLPVIVAKGVTRMVEDGQRLSVDLAEGTLRNLDTGATLATRSFSAQMLAIWRAGSLVAYTRAQLAAGSLPGKPATAG